MSPLFTHAHRLFTAIAFWVAIILAFAYPAVLLAVDHGILPGSAFILFVGVHFCTLAVGHRYSGNRDAYGA